MIAILPAMARQLWWRHRRGMVGSLVGLAAMALTFPPVHGWALRQWPESSPTLMLVGLLLGFQLVFYPMSVFMLSDGPLGDMSSGFSRRMFTLPVRTR